LFGWAVAAPLHSSLLLLLLLSLCAGISPQVSAARRAVSQSRTMRSARCGRDAMHCTVLHCTDCD
jgi:hypothetical protein